ncbi:hypothetical protein M406DRAFT_104323 [Cryphonectria parasitica EP155]|uniref:Uncharacterized protein n=1 Tax=Cryphonectria parasitica (strain ATCC 38755 / EP155) TaxID=660469 RepID=A0A9P5CLG7_CRYP1|nr:uncharacterized protein M406DRAFT_104323 [Cryphonectria parasitica EP155]KAF3761810.1 hypothetical protein M406DRAFT_104323 [Cryphonectria parasitica EP155]
MSRSKVRDLCKYSINRWFRSCGYLPSPRRGKTLDISTISHPVILERMKAFERRIDTLKTEHRIALKVYLCVDQYELSCRKKLFLISPYSVIPFRPQDCMLDVRSRHEGPTSAFHVWLIFSWFRADSRQSVARITSCGYNRDGRLPVDRIQARVLQPLFDRFILGNAVSIDSQVPISEKDG